MAEKESDSKLTNEYGGSVEVEVFDITPFVGKKVEIAKVENFHGRMYGNPYVKVSTEEVTKTASGDSVTGSRIFNMKYGEKNSLVWPKDGKLDKFLKSHGVSSPDELVGKVVQLIPSEPKGENNVRFLTFN